jgi:hypothetical protein
MADLTQDFEGTPHPSEEQAETDNSAPRWSPWEGPTHPSWYAGMGEAPIEGIASAAYKTEAVAAGAGAEVAGAMGAKSTADWLREDEQSARGQVRAWMPDPSTTGLAANALRSVAEGGALMLTGAMLGGPLGAAAMVGGVEGPSRYADLKEQGVDTRTAAEAGLVTGITSAAGAVVPLAYGESLLTQAATGAVGMTGFGLVNRFADHLILEKGGYPDMAAQQKVFDTSQMLVDAALGATFGVIQHYTSPHEEAAAKALQTPDNRDAALTANLSLRDRQAAPGVPVDPESANAHQSAMEKAVEDVAAGRPVDVSESKVLDGSFLSRPDRDFTPEQKILLDTFKESGLLDEEANLRDLEESLEGRQAERPSVKEMAERAAARPFDESDVDKAGDYRSQMIAHLQEKVDGFNESGDMENAKAYQKALDLSKGTKPIPRTIDGTAIDITSNAPSSDPVVTALEHRPNLQIADENGETRNASDALEKANEAGEKASEFGVATRAAAACFARMGA